MHTTLAPFLEKESNQGIENIHLTLCSVKKIVIFTSLKLKFSL